jgi:mannose-6-phosphate isomerase-like protein (cupin superfamily)
MVDIVRQNEAFPEWCELCAFSVHEVRAGAEVQLDIRQPRSRVLVTAGSCQVRQAGRSQVLREQQFADFAPGAATLLSNGTAQVMLLEGTWGGELGGCGVFRAENVANPSDKGDPVSYPKHSNIDAHYHDCDEYWLLLSGRARVVVDGAFADMAPGDCLLIPMGAMHDMPDVPDPIAAVYFESSLRGQKRTGHLWQHTHGPAQRG